MQDLIKLLEEKNGLTPEQSKEVLNTIISYVKEKFPMIEGMVENLFSSGGSEN